MAKQDNERPMTKEQAIALLGGSQCEAGERVGVSQQAISQWPAVLTPKLRDRVQAVLWREHVQRMERLAIARERGRRRPNASQDVPAPQVMQ